MKTLINVRGHINILKDGNYVGMMEWDAVFTARNTKGIIVVVDHSGKRHGIDRAAWLLFKKENAREYESQREHRENITAVYGRGGVFQPSPFDWND